MMYRIVYRVEMAASGCGPYHGWEAALAHHNNGTTHPTPHVSGLPIGWGGLVCGFASRRAYRRWFSAADRRVLRRMGARLRTYRVPAHEVHGPDTAGQVTFVRSGEPLTDTRALR